jgi:hypothetical protein
MLARHPAAMRESALQDRSAPYSVVDPVVLASWAKSVASVSSKHFSCPIKMKSSIVFINLDE